MKREKRFPEKWFNGHAYPSVPRGGVWSTLISLFLVLGGLFFTFDSLAMTFPSSGYTTIIQDGVDPGTDPCRDILSVGYQQDGTNSYFSIQMNCTDLSFNNQRFFVALDIDGDGENDFLLWMDNPQKVQLFSWDGTQWVDTLSPTADFADPNLDPDDTIFLGVAMAELGLTGSGDSAISASTAKANNKLDPTCNDLGCQGGGDTTGTGEIGIAFLSIFPDSVCLGEPSAVTANGTDVRVSFATFIWSGPSGTNRFTQSQVPFAGGLSTSSYGPPDSEGFWKISVTYFDGAGVPLPDALDPEMDEIFLNTHGPTPDAGADASICLGGSVAIGGGPTAWGGTGPYIYSWSPGSGLDDPASSNPIASPSVSMVYTVTVTDVNGCSLSSSVSVTVNDLPNADAGSDSTICLGDSLGLGGAPSATGGTGPYSYSWSPAGSLDDPSLANPVATPSTSTTFALTVTDANSCTSSGQNSVTVAICAPDLLRRRGPNGALDRVADLEQPGFLSGASFPNNSLDFFGGAGDLIFYEITSPTDTLRVTKGVGVIVITY